MIENREDTCREIARRVSDTFGGVRVVVHFLPGSARFSVYGLSASRLGGLHQRIITRVPWELIEAVEHGHVGVGQLAKDIVDSTRWYLEREGGEA